MRRHTTSFHFRGEFPFPILYLLILLLLGGAEAKTELKFQPLQERDGLLSPFIRHVAEDSHGFLWIAGQSGLQRFDGRSFLNFRHAGASENALLSDFITSLFIDKQDNVWIGTNKGLQVYSQTNEKMNRVELAEEAKLEGNALQINAFHEMGDGQVWIGTNRGLFAFELSTGKMRYSPHYAIASILSISDQKLLIGTLKNGLYAYDIQTDKYSFINSPHSNTGALAPESEAASKSPFIHVTGIVKRTDNEFFISTWGQGVFLYHAVNHQLSEFAVGLPDLFIRQIQHESVDKYWVATRTGLYLLDLFSGVTTNSVELKTTNELDDAEKRVTKLFRAKNNNIWIATAGYGLFEFVAQSRQFEFFDPAIGNESGLQNKVVIDFAETTVGDILLGKLSGKVSLFDPESESFKHLKFKKNNQPFSGIITAIRSLANNELLVSSYPESFLVRTDLEVQEITESRQYDFFKNIALIRTNQNQTLPFVLAHTDTHILLLATDDKNRFYIKHALPYVQHELNRFSLQKFTNYFVAQDRSVYIADVAGGIIRIHDYNSQEPKLTTIRERDQSYIDSIFVDKNNSIWIAIEGGGVY